MNNFIAYNDAKISYDIHGQGEPLIYIHGWHSTPKSFKTHLLGELSKSFTVIIIDLPGYGRSASIELSFDAINEIVHKILLSLSYNKTNLVGYCMGASFAMDFAIRNPEMVRRLILIETYIKYPFVIYPLLVESIGKPLFKFAINTSIGLFCVKKYLLLKGVDYGEDFFNSIYECNLDTSIQYIRQLYEYSKLDHKNRISKISAFTTIIKGEKTHRKIVKTSNMLHSLIKKCRLVTIKDSRHFPIEENRVELLKTIKASLN